MAEFSNPGDEQFGPQPAKTEPNVNSAMLDATEDTLTIIHGKKAEALAAIAATTDLKGLKMFVNGDDVLKGDWRRAAVRKRIEKLEKELAGK